MPNPFSICEDRLGGTFAGWAESVATETIAAIEIQCRDMDGSISTY